MLLAHVNQFLNWWTNETWDLDSSNGNSVEIRLSLISSPWVSGRIRVRNNSNSSLLPVPVPRSRTTNPLDNTSVCKNRQSGLRVLVSKIPMRYLLCQDMIVESGPINIPIRGTTLEIVTVCSRVCSLKSNWLALTDQMTFETSRVIPLQRLAAEQRRFPLLLLFKYTLPWP